jgi:23S rRNA (cytosine1962-C5)-methyltransferase
MSKEEVMGRPYRGSGRRTHQKPRKTPSDGVRFPAELQDGVSVNGYSSEWLGKGFDWVYPDEIVARKGNTVSGSVVRILNSNGKIVGTGVASDGKVAVRRFRGDGGPLDQEFIGKRVAEAAARRRRGEETTAWRWIHGENDGLPGIRVDVWGPFLTLVIDHPSLQCLVPMLVEALVEQGDVTAIWQNERPQHDEDRSGPSAGTILYGDAPEEEIEVLEMGLRFAVKPQWGLDAGLYPDMRELRCWLKPYWKGRKVLNTFAYTGAFSVAAAIGGALRVDTVDLAAPAIERAKKNFTINDLDVEHHGFWTEDTFKALDRFRRKGEDFDLVILDPPSFARGPNGIWSVERELGRLVASGLRVLKPGGWILVATNQGSISPKEFQKFIKIGADKAGRNLRLIHQGTHSHDFPAALAFPESRYLKAWVLEG